MKKFKKVLLFTASFLAISPYSSALAEELSPEYVAKSSLKVKISGYADFQAGYRNQGGLTSQEKNVSAHRNSFAFNNVTGLFVRASNEINGVEYGGKIVLAQTAKKKGAPSYNGSHIFIQTEDFGKFEAGSPIDPASTMSVDGSSASVAVDDWDNYANLSSSKMKFNGLEPSFATFTEFFLDSKLVTSTAERRYSTEPSRKINYYTPKIGITGSSKIQFGISYIPDSGNTGADSFSKNSTGEQNKSLTPDGSRFIEINKAVKDSFSAGISFEQNISDGVDFKTAFTGEYGKAAGKAKEMLKNSDTGSNDLVAEHKLKGLVTYNVGAVLSVGSFSCAGSYGSLGKSLTTPVFHKTGQNTKYYSGSVAYNQGPFATSLSFFRSNQYKNTVDAISIGADYKIAPGIKPYATISAFSANGKPELYPEAPKRKTRGTVALIGAKLSL